MSTEYDVTEPEAGYDESTGFRCHALQAGGRRFDPCTAH
jgi:hypothetical protein